MAEGETILVSAVAPGAKEASTALKRGPSDDDDRPATKRTRLSSAGPDTDATAPLSRPPEQGDEHTSNDRDNGADQRQNHQTRVDDVPAPTEAAASGAGSPPTQTAPEAEREQPVRKRRTIDGREEERRRTKRLFGAMLGTLGSRVGGGRAQGGARGASAGDGQSHKRHGSSGSAGAGATPGENDAAAARMARRESLEEQQRAKLARMGEEQADRRERERERLEALRTRRRRAQWRVDADAMAAGHANLRAQARFLSTQAEPKLFYLPQKLTPEEADRLAGQAEDIEARLVPEAEQFEQKLAAAVAAGEADDIPVPWAGGIGIVQRVPGSRDGEAVEGAEPNGHTSETRDGSPRADGEDRSANGDGLQDGEDERDGERAPRPDAGLASAMDAAEDSRRSPSKEATDVGEADADAAGVAADGKDHSTADGGRDDVQHGEMMVEEEEDTVLF